MPYCSRCSTELHPDARFCVQCGAPVAEERAPVAPPDDDITDRAMPTADVTQAIEVDLLACPRCGGSNAARRTRCGRCGAALEGAVGPSVDRAGDTPPTGNPTVPPPPSPTPAPPRPAAEGTETRSDHRAPPRRRRRRGIAAAFVVGGLLVGAGIGVAAGTGVGPFARPVEVDFDPGSYPAEPASVRPARTGATSTHPPADGRAFGPTRAVDADRSTAWAPQPDDAEAQLVHRFAEPVWLDHIEVASGLPDDATVEGVGRVTGARIDLRTLQVDASIEDQPGVQVIPLPERVLVEEVTWRVTRSSGGTGAFAEVRYRGWPADEGDREALRGR